MTTIKLNLSVQVRYGLHWCFVSHSIIFITVTYKYTRELGEENRTLKMSRLNFGSLSNKYKSSDVGSDIKMSLHHHHPTIKIIVFLLLLLLLIYPQINNKINHCSNHDTKTATSRTTLKTISMKASRTIYRRTSRTT